MGDNVVVNGSADDDVLLSLFVVVSSVLCRTIEFRRLEWIDDDDTGANRFGLWVVDKDATTSAVPPSTARNKFLWDELGDVKFVILIRRVDEGDNNKPLLWESVDTLDRRSIIDAVEEEESGAFGTGVGGTVENDSYVVVQSLIPIVPVFLTYPSFGIFANDGKVRTDVIPSND